MYRSNQSQNITLVIIVINVVVFFLTYMAPGLYEFLAIYPDGLFNRRFIWTPVTYMFVHGGITHIIFNMIFLLIVGPSVERSMGQKDFVAYYFVCGALAGLFSIVAYLNSGRNIPIVGASGAIYAVMLAFATYYPGARFFFLGYIPDKGSRSCSDLLGNEYLLSCIRRCRSCCQPDAFEWICLWFPLPHYKNED